MTLEQFGWTGFFESQESSGLVGRVAAANHGRFLVWTETDEVDAGVSGLLTRKGTYTRQADDGSPGVTFGDPILDSITSPD